MIIEILFVVVMFLWLLTILPLPPMAPFASSNVFFGNQVNGQSGL